MSAIPWKFPRTGIAAVDRILSEIADRLRRRFAELDAVDAAKQPLDATLTALAGVTTAANKLIYATGSDTFSTTDLSVFIRTVLDDSDAAAVRSTIGAQASSTRLSDIVNLSLGAGDMLYWDGTHFQKVDASAASTGDVLKWNDVTSVPYWEAP